MPNDSEIIHEKDDVELEPIPSEIEDEESTPEEFEIATIPADFTLETLFSKWKSEEIVIPKFQRGFVWKKRQSSMLVESFMMGLPVPQIFLYTDAEQKLLIIDGQQRLRSIFYFFEGYFGEPDERGRRTVFKLSEINVKSKWYNRSFDEFEDSNKRRFKNSVLRAIIVKQLDPDDDTSVYHIFERLNTGGTLLKDQEVRNCVYGGKLNDLLFDLNQYPAWRRILGKPKPDSRQKDIELILRYIALFNWLDRYKKKPMKDFLSTCMKRQKNPDESFLSGEKTRFEQTCDIVIRTLGDKPFSPRGPLNASVFDSVFTAFAKNVNRCPDDIQLRYQQLLKNEDFDTNTRSATTDPERVSQRFELAMNLFLRGSA
jgi:hypothetical protein